MTNFLKATLQDGTEVISEFSKLQGSGERYIAQVFAGVKPFNAWKVVGHQHPQSGEAVLIRTREMYSGQQIKKVCRVQPVEGQADTHGYQPQFFVPVTEIQGGQYGTWEAPAENTPQDAVAGALYPIHRDDASMERFVYLKVASDPETHEGEIRYLIDRRTVVLGGDPIEALMASGTTAVPEGEVRSGWDEEEDRPLRDADDDIS
jgi:hypothetical protein